MWKRTLLLVCFSLFVVLSGCESQEDRLKREAVAERKEAERKAAAETAKAEHRSKIEALRKMKVLNIRENDTTIDFILEDGTIITIYSYLTGSDRRGYFHHVGIK